MASTIRTDDSKAAQSTPVEADWIGAARAMLVEKGIASVQISPLAGRLGVTRGGFYWRFRNRQDLLDHIIEDWRNRNTRPLLMAVERAGAPKERFRRLIRLWIEEKDFDPALDAAVRHWGSIDPDVADKVHEADNLRIAALARIFLDAGQTSDEATARARLIYFHQVGYYALGMRETREQRKARVPIYTRILTGHDDWI